MSATGIKQINADFGIFYGNVTCLSDINVSGLSGFNNLVGGTTLSERYVLHPAPEKTGDQEVSPHPKGATHPPPNLRGGKGGEGSSLGYSKQVERPWQG